MFSQVFLPLVMSAVAALPPHPLDKVFAMDEKKQVIETMTKSPLFNEAVEAALTAKKEAAKERKDKPGFVGPSLEQVARQKFLEILQKGEVKTKDKDK